MESIHSDMKTFSQMLDELGEEIAATDADIYDCPICRDTGWVSDGANAYPCSCRKKQQEQNRFALPPKLAKTNFSNFLLDKYSREIIPNREISYRNLAEKALISAKDFASAYLSGGNPPGFILIGPTGCGKTHLVAATANSLLASGVDVLFLVVPEFLDQLRDSYRRESQGMSEGELIKRAYTAQVLVLDDLGAHNFTEWVQNKLFTIINYRLNHELPCLITTNLKLDEMNSCIGRRTTSRLMEGCRKLFLASKVDFRTQENFEVGR